MEQLYLNPYCSILADDAKAYLFTTQEEQLVLTPNQAKSLLASLPCSAEQLLTFLSVAELEALLVAGLLKTEPIVTDTHDAVNRGWFLATKKEETFEQLKTKTVMILGCGGLGSHAAWNMIALGISHLILIDDDVVSIDNLNRQLWYTQQDIGQPKVTVLKQALHKINPNATIDCFQQKIIDPDQTLTPILEKYAVDLVIKAVDHPENHLQLFSDYFAKKRLPYTSGGTLGTGLIFGPTYHPNLPNQYQKALSNQPTLQRLHVKGVSLPMGMEKVAGAINLEAFYLLTDQLAEVRFNDRIHYESLFTTNQTFTETITKHGLSHFLLPALTGFFSAQFIYWLGLFACLFLGETLLTQKKSKLCFFLTGGCLYYVTLTVSPIFLSGLLLFLGSSLPLLFYGLTELLTKSNQINP